MSPLVRAPSIRLGWAPWLAGMLAVGLARLVGAVWRHPWLAASTVALVVLVDTVRGHGPVVLVFPLVGAALLVAWWSLEPGSFERAVARPARSRWRRAVVYRREWQPAMTVSGLDRYGLPRLGRVVAEPDRDVLHVRDLAGTVAEWQAAGPRLARVFGVRSVRARQHPARHDTIVLTARRRVSWDAPPATPRGGGGVVTRPSPELVVEAPPRGAFPRTPGGDAA